MQKINWKTEKVPLSKLSGYENNPRKIKDENLDILRNSINKFGQVKPLVVNTDYTVIGGNQRLKVLPDGDVYVAVPDRTLNEDEVKELVIILNNKIGDWDIEKLEILGFDEDVLVNTFGFDEELVAGMGFDFDDLDFDDIGKGKVIKKFIVNFKDFHPDEIEDLITRLKEQYNCETQEEMLLTLLELYETDNA